MGKYCFLREKQLLSLDTVDSCPGVGPLETAAGPVCLEDRQVCVGL